MLLLVSSFFSAMIVSQKFTFIWKKPTGIITPVIFFHGIGLSVMPHRGELYCIIFIMHHLQFIGYNIVHCLYGVSINLDFNNPGNILPMIFLFVDASFYYILIIKSFPKTLCFGMLFTLTIVCTVRCSIIWLCETHTLWLNQSEVYKSGSTYTA